MHAQGQGQGFYSEGYGAWGFAPRKFWNITSKSVYFGAFWVDSYQQHNTSWWLSVFGRWLAQNFSVGGHGSK